MYYLHIGNKTERFADPKEAGKAFYNADIDTKPYVSIKEGGEEVRLSETKKVKDDLHGDYTKKIITRSASKEEGFVAGYHQALVPSLEKKIKSVNWEVARSAQNEQSPLIDQNIYNELEELAKYDRKAAERIWSENVPKDIAAPAIADPKWNKLIEEKKELSAALDNIDKEDPTKDKQEVGSWNNFVERDDVLERAKQNREKDRLGNKAETKRIEVEELEQDSRIQDSKNDGPNQQREGLNQQKQVETEKEKERQIELMEQVYKQFHASGNEFRYKDRRGLAFRQKGNVIQTNNNDQKVARAMATVASAKGWGSMTVSGNKEFRRQMWVEGSQLGINVNGYKPTEMDIQQLDKKKEQAMKNQISREDKPGNTGRGDIKGKTRESANISLTGRLVAHGAAPYKDDPKNQQSYFVTLQTEKGEETRWGKALKHKLENNKDVKKGDKLTLIDNGRSPVEIIQKGVRKEVSRREWEIKTAEGKRLKSTSDLYIKSKFPNDPHHQNVASAQAEKLLRDRQNREPKIEIYDVTAQPKQEEHKVQSQEQKQDKERSR